MVLSPFFEGWASVVCVVPANCVLIGAMRTSSRWVVTSLVATAVVAGGVYGSRLRGDATAGPKVANQVWLSHMPTGPRDLVGHLVVLDRNRKREGVAGIASRYRFSGSVVWWALEANRMTLFFPQVKKRTDWTVRTWACAGEAPAPFELCLELKPADSSKKTFRFYSMRDWVVDRAGKAPDGLEAPVHAALQSIEGTDAALPSEDWAQEPSSSISMPWLPTEPSS